MVSTMAGTATTDEAMANTKTLLTHQRRGSSASHTQLSGMNTDQRMNRYTISAPALLQGIRYFVDASTSPHQPSIHLRQAGLGILLVNTEVQPTQTVYIKAILADCSSVLMAEAAAIALAVQIIQSMNLTNISFLSDCQQLVHFLNTADHSNPPDWRIKHFTQLFTNHSRCRGFKIFKIDRRLNTTADAQSRQALSHLVSQEHHLETSCSYEHHDHKCSLLQALQNVSLTNVLLLSARCC